MNLKKLGQLKRQLAEMRNSPQRASALERLAKKLGRKKIKRGKEPTWESQIFEHLNVLTIPHHGGGAELALGTKNSLLIQLEDDINAWETELEKDKDK